MSNNISTNFDGFDNLNSTTALHHVTVPITFSANVANGNPVAATDLRISGVYEAQTMITDIQIIGTLPRLPVLPFPDSIDWVVEAVSEAGTVFTIATFAHDIPNPAALTSPGYFTKIVAVPSGNFRLRFNVAAGTFYDGAIGAAPTMYVTYMNAH